MLSVLSDVTMGPKKFWARSLRCWRMRRGLRDVVFGEPGSLGLELDEPRLAADGGLPGENAWRLRGTHPPASALKMQEQSVLVAINYTRVHERDSPQRSSSSHR